MSLLPGTPPPGGFAPAPPRCASARLRLATRGSPPGTGRLYPLEVVTHHISTSTHLNPVHRIGAGSKVARMRALLAIAAAGEALTGLGLFVTPPTVVQLLFGAEITGAGIVMSRIAGLALIAL